MSRTDVLLWAKTSKIFRFLNIIYFPAAYFWNNRITLTINQRNIQCAFNNSLRYWRRFKLRLTNTILINILHTYLNSWLKISFKFQFVIFIFVVVVVVIALFNIQYFYVIHRYYRYLGGEYMYGMFICTRDTRYYRCVQISDYYYYALSSRFTDPHGCNITVILFAFALQLPYKHGSVEPI